MQRCPSCQNDLPESEFAPSSRGRAGTYCKACRRARYRNIRPAEPRPCASCSMVIEQPTRADQRFCSQACKAAETRRRRATGEPPPARPALPPRTRAGQIDTTICMRCGGEFSYIRKRGDRALCDACRLARDGRSDGARYGMSVAEAVALRRQAKKCDLCGETSPGRGFRGWHLDHNHETGAFRGVLCGPCNIGIGHFADDVTRLRKAIEYLTRHESREEDHG